MKASSSAIESLLDDPDRCVRWPCGSRVCPEPLHSESGLRRPDRPAVDRVPAASPSRHPSRSRITRGFRQQSTLFFLLPPTGSIRPTFGPYKYNRGEHRPASRRRALARARRRQRPRRQWERARHAGPESLRGVRCRSRCAVLRSGKVAPCRHGDHRRQQHALGGLERTRGRHGPRVCGAPGVLRHARRGDGRLGLVGNRHLPLRFVPRAVSEQLCAGAHHRGTGRSPARGRLSVRLLVPLAGHDCPLDQQLGPVPVRLPPDGHLGPAALALHLLPLARRGRSRPWLRLADSAGPLAGQRVRAVRLVEFDHQRAGCAGPTRVCAQRSFGRAQRARARVLPDGLPRAARRAGAVHLPMDAHREHREDTRLRILAAALPGRSHRARRGDLAARPRKTDRHDRVVPPGDAPAERAADAAGADHPRRQ